jgi:hypothetical protein
MQASIKSVVNAANASLRDTKVNLEQKMEDDRRKLDN